MASTTVCSLQIVEVLVSSKFLNIANVSKTKNSEFHIRLPILLTLAVAAGILIGATMADGNSTKNDLISGITKLKDILMYVERDYVDEVDTEQLIDVAINTVLEKLDPHSVYIPAEELELAKSQLEGEFEGIGIEFSIVRDTIYVVAPLGGGPSEEVGLMSGDKIVKVDGDIVVGDGIDNQKVFELLRGPKGSEVMVSVKRHNQKDLLDFKIIRDKIPQNSVDVSYMVDNEVGYIKISRFAATTYDEFKVAMDELEQQGMKKLILDLQNNPGGYMDRAINIADEFLKDNKLIVYTEGKQPRYNSEARAYRKGTFEDQPLIVLIDEGSASASEIVAGALQDNDRALIVGRRSFGKGLVQLPISLSDNSELRLTISRYYTPSGRSIQKPYDPESDDYSREIAHRFEHGEFFNKDSIIFNDSLKFSTTKGRTVYGGGGIMPDYFVPLDTAEGRTKYFGKLYTSNALREYTLTYYEKHKEELEAMEYRNFFKDFKVTDAMLQDLNRVAKNLGVEYEEKDFEQSKGLIKNNVKALIARSVWDSKGFFPVFNENNEVFQKALELFDEAENLASM